MDDGRNQAGPQDHSGGEGALADLVEVEARIETDLAAARVEAERIVEAARRESALQREDGDGRLEAEREALRTSIGRDCEAKIQAIRDRADEEARRYQRVEAEELAALARFVAARIVDAEDSP